MSANLFKREIANIMDDGADKDHSENSDNSEAEQIQTLPNASKGGEAKDDGAARVRGGSVIETDDGIFGEASSLGRKRSNSIEANRPRARQEHSNIIGSILENIHENINFDDDAHPEEDTGLDSAPS